MPERTECLGEAWLDAARLQHAACVGVGNPEVHSSPARPLTLDSLLSGSTGLTRAMGRIREHGLDARQGAYHETRA